MPLGNRYVEGQLQVAISAMRRAAQACEQAGLDEEAAAIEQAKTDIRAVAYSYHVSGEFVKRGRPLLGRPCVSQDLRR